MKVAERPSLALALALAFAFAVLTPGCGSSRPTGNGSVPRPHVVVGDAGPLSPLPDDCGAHLTDYPGDCQAPPAVDPSTGLLAHYGPKDYDDPAQIAEYVIQPGDELVDCVYPTLTNDADFFYQRYDVYSRPGSHHVILSTATAAPPDGSHDNCGARDHGSALLAVVQGGIRGDAYHYPPSGVIPPENAGLATKLAPHQSIAYELHAINATEEPLLRENWTVFQTMDPSKVTASVGQMAFNGGLAMRIEPHTKQTIKNSCSVGGTLGTIRVVDFFGHMHSHGQRFSAWAVHTDSSGTETRTLIYESYDWSKLDLIELNSVEQNTPASYASGTPGGMSGDLYLSPGDRLDYECLMNNTEDFALTFAAKAVTGEMCNLFGSFTPGTLWSCVGN